jgi:hypothetical protein
VRWGDVEDEEGEPEFFGLTKKIIGVERGVAGGQGLQSFGLTTTTAGGGGGGGVTMAAQTKFIQPPLFAGKEEEDVTEWMVT